MEKFERSQLQDRQQLKLLKTIECLKNEAAHNEKMARRDADDLKRFIHILRALSWISPNERNYYLEQIEKAVNGSTEAKHDDTLVGCIRQSMEEGR